MNVEGSGIPESDWTDDELRAVSTALSMCAPYVLRLARAGAYAIATFLFMWLQPHFTFSYLALALGVFFLATVRRTTWIAEVVLALVVLATFVPVALLRTLLGLS